MKRIKTKLAPIASMVLLAFVLNSNQALKDCYVDIVDRCLALSECHGGNGHCEMPAVMVSDAFADHSMPCDALSRDIARRCCEITSCYDSGPALCIRNAYTLSLSAMAALGFGHFIDAATAIPGVDSLGSSHRPAVPRYIQLNTFLC